MDIASLPAGGIFAVLSAKLEEAEKVAVRVSAAELSAQVEEGHGPISESGREELKKVCAEALKALGKARSLDEERAKLQRLAAKTMGSPLVAPPGGNADASESAGTAGEVQAASIPAVASHDSALVDPEAHNRSDQRDAPGDPSA